MVHFYQIFELWCTVIEMFPKMCFKEYLNLTLSSRSAFFIIKWGGAVDC